MNNVYFRFFCARYISITTMSHFCFAMFCSHVQNITFVKIVSFFFLCYPANQRWDCWDFERTRDNGSTGWKVCFRLLHFLYCIRMATTNFYIYCCCYYAVTMRKCEMRDVYYSKWNSWKFVYIHRFNCHWIWNTTPVCTVVLIFYRCDFL